MHPRHPIIVAALAAMAACTRNSSGSDAPGRQALTAPPPEASASSALADGLTWGPAPAVFPPGAEIAVLEGDPSAAQPFTVRLRFPNGYRIAPHTHPTTENVTILAGTLLAGMGNQFDEPKLREFRRDAFASIPADQPHYVMARGLTVVQVHALGPFVLTYVDPRDDPRGR